MCIGYDSRNVSEDNLILDELMNFLLFIMNN